jgi:hypothetical protein
MQAPPGPGARSPSDWRNRLYQNLSHLLQALDYRRFFVAFDECTALGIASGSDPEDNMTLLALQRIHLQTDAEFSGVYLSWIRLSHTLYWYRVVP